jgi:hypothetical protein
MELAGDTVNFPPLLMVPMRFGVRVCVLALRAGFKW